MVSVKTSHRTVSGGLQGLMDRVQALNRINKLYVGIPQEKTSRGDEPINNASLLYIHTHGIRRKSMREEMQGYMDQGMEYSLAYQLYVQTHGSPLWHAPPRPVIEPAIAKHHREIAEEYAKAVKAAMTGDGSRADAFIKRTGLLAQNICRKWFTDAENGWPPNSPKTIDKKTKGKGGKTNPLIDTGALRKAIVYVVRSD